MKRPLSLLAIASAVALGMIAAAPARADQILIGLITKTDNNPFFVKMREGANAKAKELGATLQSFAGNSTATTTPRSPRSRA